jgi:hypothetical protein
MDGGVNSLSLQRSYCCRLFFVCAELMQIMPSPVLIAAGNEIVSGCVAREFRMQRCEGRDNAPCHRADLVVTCTQSRWMRSPASGFMATPIQPSSVEMNVAP